MDDELRKAYQTLEEDAKCELRANRGSSSVLSTLMHALLLYPNHPFGLAPLYATRWDKKTQRRERFVVAKPAELSRNVLYPKESTLIEDITQELAEGRRCQVYAVYRKTQERLKQVLERAGFRVALLTVKVRPSQREAWYARRVQEGVQVVLAHPKLVETGLDLLDFPTLYFYETGHSLHLMRQASRRSWRIGQRLPVRIKFLVYAGTAQDLCLELMFKKLLVALTTEGQFCGEGPQDAQDDESDILAAVARGLMKQDIGETAEAAWRTLRETEAALATAGLVAPVMSSESLEEAAISSGFPDEEDETWHPPSVPVIDPGPTLIFGERPEGYFRTRHRPRVDVPGQGSLFDCG